MANSGGESKRFLAETEKCSVTATVAFSEAPYFLTVHYHSITYFLIFSYRVERSIGIGMSLADSGVPVEDWSQGYPEADWDTVLGDVFLEA